MTDDDKPVRLPWEKTPWVDFEAASHKAIAAASATHTDPKSAVVASYAQRAFADEIERVRSAPSGERNTILFKAGANLYELVYAGALSETEVDAALREACMANHYIQDDGESGFEKSLNSAKRRGRDNPRDLSAVGTKVGASFDLSDETPKLLKLSGFQHLERGFWTERDSLQTVYLAALSRMCSPWAVLAHCIARALAMVRPHVTLPPLIGGAGSLNWFAVVAATSGGGKGGAAAVARELVPSDIVVRNLGSGEGVVDAYARPGNKETGEPPGTCESVMFEANEIDALTALGQRSGSTLSVVLRSAWAGETLGFSNRTASRLHLKSHSYRMTLVLSAQPERCGNLLGEANGGMPQRFQWFPGRDSRIKAERPAMPGNLTLPPLSAWLYGTTLKVPYETAELIADAQERANDEDAAQHDMGTRHTMDGHALFTREKFAFGLAVIDGRSEMTSDDWRLAGTAMRVSDHVRDFVTQQVEAAATVEAEHRGKVRGVEFDAANNERTSREFARDRRIRNWVVGQLKDAGPEGTTQGQLGRRAAGRDRPMVGLALKALERDGEAVRVDGVGTDKTERWKLV